MGQLLVDGRHGDGGLRLSQLVGLVDRGAAAEDDGDHPLDYGESFA
ncbi:MAG: hypothetical protein NZX77_04510 [Polyangiaceae bacterium]|nr:hypothetical protein [Polyangiaceae bacterium]